MALIHKLTSAFLSLDEKSDCFISQLLFIAPVCVWVFFWLVLRRTMLPPVLPLPLDFSTIRIVCLAVVLTREVLFGCWNRRAFLGLVVFSFLAYAAFEVDAPLVLDTIVFAFCGRNVDFRRIAICCFITIVMVLVITVGSSLFGTIPNSVTQDASRTRYLLGFRQPNRASILLFFALCLWVYLRERKFGVIDASIWALALVTLYAFTHSRTSFITSMALVVLALFLKWVPRKILQHPAFSLVEIFPVMLFAVGGIVLAVIYDPSNEVMVGLNSLLSGRLGLGHSAIQEYGFSLMPQNVNMSGATYLDVATNTMVARNGAAGIIIDCIYVKACVSYGLVFLALVLMMSVAVAIRAYHRGQWYLLLVLGLIALHGLFEGSCAYGTYNAFLFLMGELFYSRAERSGC